MQTYFSVVGYGSSGKTTLVKKLVTELRTRGYKLAVVKHDPKGHGVVDRDGSDTSLFWEAGSEAVMLASPSRLTLFKRMAQDPTLEEIMPLCGEVDCVILEGFKSRPYPRVVIWSEEEGLEPPGVTVLAIIYTRDNEQKVRKAKEGSKIPLFNRDDITGLADLLEKTLLHKK